MRPQSLADAFLILAVAQGVVEAVILSTGRRGRRPANRLFAALLIAFCGAIALHAMAENQGVPLRTHARNASAVLLFLFGPLLHLYARALAHGRAARAFDARHFVVAAFAALVALVAAIVGDGVPEQTHHVLGVAVVAHVVLYVAAIFRMLRSTHPGELDSTSATRRGGMRWLRIVIVLFGAFWMAAAAAETVGSGRWWTLPWSVLALLVFGIGYQGLREPEAFAEDDPAVPSAGPKYAKSGLSAEAAARLAARIVEVTEKERLHLDPRITLRTLASRAGASQHDVSRVLNEVIGRSFFDFVNAYRVDEAKREIADPANDGTTLAAIATRCGFQSLSAFNAAFRRIAGFPPSAFRAEQSRLRDSGEPAS